MFLTFLCLIVLALMAHQTRKPLAAGVLYGLIRGIGSFYYVVNKNTDAESLYLAATATGAFQFIANAALGYGIAYIIVNHPKNLGLTFLNVFAIMLTFLTDWVDVASMF